MQELSQNQAIKEPSKTPWLISIGFLALVLIASLALWGYGFLQAKTIEKLNTEIASLDTEIASGSLNKEIIVADILRSARIRPSINLKGLVDGFRSVATQNGVQLKGFAVQNDVITSSLTALATTTGTDPVKTIIDMMRAKDIGGGLTLEPIYSVQGTTDERKTNISFKIVSPNIPTNVK